MQIFTSRNKYREHVTQLEKQLAALSIRNAELVAFLKTLPESIRKSKGGAEILAQRDALVEKASLVQP